MTPAGSVAIGGIQTGIGSIAAPSGWNLLGRTPVMTFHPTRNPAFLIAPGDRVRFQPVDASLWDELEARALAGDWVAEPIGSDTAP
jgi:5-oxoprolinase (ATP-hydrolysing) subunit B